MNPFKLTDEEKAKILEQHKELEKKAQERKDLMKKGLQKPEEKTPE